MTFCYPLADRNRGCRLVPDVAIEAETEETAAAVALKLGFNTDFDTGNYHLVNMDQLRAEMRAAGKVVP